MGRVGFKAVGRGGSTMIESDGGTLVDWKLSWCGGGYGSYNTEFIFYLFIYLFLVFLSSCCGLR